MEGFQETRREKLPGTPQAISNDGLQAIKTVKEDDIPNAEHSALTANSCFGNGGDSWCEDLLS